MKDSTMNVQLNQTEIETAIRQYVNTQGIDLRNKTLAVEFTSGRKANGLSAELVILDVVIPGFTEPYLIEEGTEDVAVATSIGELLKPADKAEVMAAGDVVIAVTAEAVKAEPVAEAPAAVVSVFDTPAVAEAAEPVVEVVKPTTTSLFG
jgi:hypothetical protein